MVKIGDKIVKDSFGTKVEYEVTGYDGSGNPITTLIGVVASDLVDEEVINEIKEAVKATESPEKAEKKPTPATKVPAKKKK